MAINTGDILQGEIIDFTHEGKGVLKSNNFIVFVQGGLVGDQVEVKIDQVKKNFALGSVTNIIKPSEDRIQLDFDISESKGGIPLIEYAYAKQLEWKRNKVIMDLGKIAGLTDVEINETIGMTNPYRYRNHTQIPVGEKNGEIVVGFYDMNSNDIVDMEGSILHSEMGNGIIKMIRDWMKKYDVKSYDKKTRKGVLRHIGLRFNRDNESMVILVTGRDQLPHKKELIQELTKENVVSIYQNINKMNSPVTYGREYRKVYGEDRLLDYIGEYKFYLSPNSFFQINRTQTKVLYDKVVEYLATDEEDIIYDLYCGIGTISLYISNEAKKIYGVEVVQQAIEDAKENAKMNHINHVEFRLGKAEEVFPSLLKEGIKGNKVVVDPPRKGCDKQVLEALVELKPERIIYVSCNPSAMARDVKYLVDNGYGVKEVQPIDMFPHTAGIESIALLTY